MEKKKLSLPKQIGIALLLGILAGYAFYMLGIPEFTTNYLKPFGTIFVNLLKFIVVPVVLLSMIDGIISNLSGIFDTVNTKVGEIAGEVCMTPAGWNGGIFNMIRGLSETVIVSIAGIRLFRIADIVNGRFQR